MYVSIDYNWNGMTMPSYPMYREHAHNSPSWTSLRDLYEVFNQIDKTIDGIEGTQQDIDNGIISFFPFANEDNQREVYYPIVLEIEEKMSKKLTDNAPIVSTETSDMFTDEELLAQKHDISVNELHEMIEKSEPKKKRERKEKNPFNALLPELFNAKGNARRHPTNPKIKTVEVREIIRKAAKISNMSSVMIVTKAGVLHLGTAFYDLCYNSKGEPIFDLVIEDLMLQGWIVRGVDFKTDQTLHTPAVTTIDKDE